MRKAMKYRIEGAGAMAPGEAADHVHLAIERENDRWYQVAWQTAQLLDVHRDRKKNPHPIQPDQLLGRGERAEPGSRDYERRRAENRRNVDEYLRRCAQRSKRNGTRKPKG